MVGELTRVKGVLGPLVQFTLSPTLQLSFLLLLYLLFQFSTAVSTPLDPSEIQYFSNSAMVMEYKIEEYTE